MTIDDAEMKQDKFNATLNALIEGRKNHLDNAKDF